MNSELFNDCMKFGKDLLLASDLDPVYTMLYKANLESSQLKRWCFAYWFFYHSGTASWISEAKSKKSFYDRMLKGIENMPRGTERRHFRGSAAYDTVRLLSTIAPEKYVDNIVSCARSFQTTIDYVTTLPQCGPWIGFKIADMIDRVFSIPVDFSDCSLNIYRDPKKGAALLYAGDQNYAIQESELNEVIKKAATKLKKYKAPPAYDRCCDIPEIETVLCKYKSYRNNRYYVGKDIHEVREHLHRVSSKTSDTLTTTLPGEV